MKITSTTPPVPALLRGLSVMRLLSAEGPLALEAVATRLALPSSSTFRLLETLRSLGYAERDSARRYRLIWTFRAGEGASAAFTARLATRMEQLAETLGVTIEWYEAVPAGMELRSQRLPTRAEVRVLARPGFVRLWNTEFDAVARLGHVFAPQAPALRARLTLFKRDGMTSRLPLVEARVLAAAARAARTASDTAFNSNGVRRAGAALLLPDGSLAGLLVAASSITFDPKAPSPARIVAALRAACTALAP